jgi:hypothetical protein
MEELQSPELRLNQQSQVNPPEQITKSEMER